MAWLNGGDSGDEELCKLSLGRQTQARAGQKVRTPGAREVAPRLVAVPADRSSGPLCGREGLVENEQRFRALVGHATELIVVWDARGRVVYRNRAARRFAHGGEVGAGRDLPSMTDIDVHPSDRDRVDEIVGDLRGHPGATARFVARYRRSDRVFRRLEVTLSNQLAEPTMRAMVAYSRDITAEHEAREALREGEAHFKALVRHSSDLVAVVDADGTLLRPTPTHVLAYPEGSLVGRNVLELVHPDDVELARSTLERAAAVPNRAFRIELRIQETDGTWRSFDVTVANHLEDPAVGGFVVNGRDITDRRHAEDVLRESERLSRSVLESIVGPTVVLDGSGTIVRANPAWDSYMRAGGASDPARGGVGANYLTMLDRAAAVDVQAAGDIAAGIRAVLAGAQNEFMLDYPARGLNDERWFVVKVSPLRTDGGGVVLLHSDITDRKRYEHQLIREAFHDPLTGLPNRALLSDRLESALGRAQRDDATVGVLFIDIDRLQVINDALGRVAGDEVLSAISTRLGELVRPGDTVSRLGGDEFVVVCEDLPDKQEAAAIAGRVLAGLAVPVGVTGGQVTATVSVGIALGRRGSVGDTLLRDADAAMYQAKERGRNRFEFFDDDLHSHALAWLNTEAALRRAITGNEFRLAYQPIVDLQTGVIRSVEALLRWDDPDRGELAPAEFLSVAEESGLIVPIGTWVLQEACYQSRRWRDEYPHGGAFPVAINVAAQQLRRPEFVDEVVAAMAEAGIGPDGIILELTETVLMDDHATPVVARLHEMGIGLALDDFGTGYSSLSHLERYSVDSVKIDASFVSGIEHNPRDTAIITAVLGITRALNLVAIAEGVETIEQRERLRDLGCDQVQGYLFGRAAPVQAISNMLRARL